MEFYEIDMQGRFLVEEDDLTINTWVVEDDRRVVRDTVGDRLYIGTSTRFSEIIQDIDYSILGGFPTNFKTAMDATYIVKTSHEVTGDWDDYTDNGIYNGDGLTNSPIGLGWVYVLVMNHNLDPTNFVTQLAIDFLSDAMYFRRNESGIWQSWQEVVHDGNLLNKITNIDGTGSGIDADLLDGQHGSYYGHLSTAPTTNDPNDADIPTMVTNHGNTPDSGQLWHIHTTFYGTATSTSNRSQMAVQYSNGSTAYVRSYYLGIWQSWNRIDNSGISGEAPVGQVASYAMTTAPAGWLLCQGQEELRITYGDLFLEIGTTYGVGDGSTTFNMPDMRGVFPRGWDDGRLLDAGRIFGSYQVDLYKSHSHQQQTRQGSGGGWPQADGLPWGTLVTSIPTLTTGGVETRPKNIALQYCIKY